MHVRIRPCLCVYCTNGMLPGTRAGCSMRHSQYNYTTVSSIMNIIINMLFHAISFYFRDFFFFLKLTSLGLL